MKVSNKMLAKRIKQPARWIIAITVVLFVMAFLSKGVTHALVLETGMFLVQPVNKSFNDLPPVQTPPALVRAS